MEKKKVETSLSRREFVRQATFIFGGILAYPVKTTASAIERRDLSGYFPNGSSRRFCDVGTRAEKKR